MDFTVKLKELNLTTEEMDRVTKALKNEEFMKLLSEYANELSDPENMKIIEKELALLEQDRGNKVDFYHPTPFRALKTSVNGKQKCYINISANEKVGKPERNWRETQDGGTRPYLSIPNVIYPSGAQLDTGAMVYDVMFHPDIVDLAGKDKLFMRMVDGTAIDLIERAFNVTVDKNNVTALKEKYKGTPRTCLIRSSIPECKEPSEEPDPLGFLDEESPPISPQTKPTESPAAKDSSDAEPKDFSIQPQGAEGPTEPHYTVKYVSYIDLQDFRCSRDSAQSPRPKEIVVTISMPLLKAAADATLEVKERQLLLESKTPAYRLELPLAYPVDEDKGQAKFNKLREQLTVTLPVLPSKEALDFAVRPDLPGVSEDDDRQEEKTQEQDEESKKSEDEEQRGAEEDLKQQTRAEEREVGEKDAGRKHKKGENTGEIGMEVNWRTKEGKGQQGVKELKDKVGNFDGSMRFQIEISHFREIKHTTGRKGGREKIPLAARKVRRARFQKKMKGHCVTEECSDKPATQSQHNILQEEEHSYEPPPVTLREIDADGKETVISDHSTSAGFVFQNSLMYELD